MSTQITEFIEYTKQNYLWSLFIVFTYYLGFLILGLSVGVSAAKALIKEYFAWKMTYEKEINKDKNI